MSIGSARAVAAMDQSQKEKKKVGSGGQMFARFASSLAAGLEAEGTRRAKAGRSGAGFASAFSSGIGGLKDFTEKLDAAGAAELDKMYFKSIDAGLDNEKTNNLAQLNLFDQLNESTKEIFQALGIASVLQGNQNEQSDFDGDTQ
jgi:hypothetical protein